MRRRVEPPAKATSSLRFLRDPVPAIDSDVLAAAAFDASSDCMIVVGRDGRLLRLNPAGQAMLPLAAEGEAFCNCMAPDSRVAVEAALAHALAGKSARVEGQALSGGGQLQWLEMAISPVTVAGQAHALAVARNIEQRRVAEERAREAENLEAIGRLAGGVAHDFNNILTVVIGNSELLAERLAADEEGKSLAEISLSAARAGADLTRMLLAYSRRQPLQPTEFCVADMLAEIRGLIERSIGDGIALDVLADEDPWGVRVDRAQLGNVLLNLALNARDAMPRGGQLSIQARNIILAGAECVGALTPGPHVMIVVSDTGTGIPAAVLERVFEPFFTTKEVGKGTGLGLAMVQGFARQSGGHVAIESRSGAGTRISLYLPRAQVQLSLPEMIPQDAEGAARPGETVMVVEDNAAVRTLIVHQLEALGYAVQAAGDGKAALEAIRRLPRLDLLLTDIVMPGLDGLKLAERARRQRPGLKIVLTSGHADHAADRADRYAQFGQLLAKPFTRQELKRRVRAAIDGRLA